MDKSFHPHDYDGLDRRLIALLREDARAPLSRLAKQLGVARGTVQNRLDRLLESGALLGFTVRIREDINDENIRAIMLVEVNGRSTSQVIRALRGMPELEKLHTTNGNWDLVAEMRAESLKEFDRLLRRVREIDGVVNSETSLLLTTI